MRCIVRALLKLLKLIHACVSAFVFVHHGSAEVMADHRPLSHYGIEDGSTVLCMKGSQ